MSAPQPAKPASNSDANATSLSLLVRLRANDADAWDRLVSIYAPLVYYWCRKLGLPDQETSDVFQDVFQSVATKIHTFQKAGPADTFRGWLRVITHNKIYDYYRRLGREPQAVGGTEANLRFSRLAATEKVDNVDNNSDDEAENQAYQQSMHRALELIRCEFTPRTWQAFWRVTVDGQRPVDIAQELNMQPGAIRVAKSRVLQRLRQELGDLMD
jgi:RNA polymerase sigma-70 factor (ECF subfamily)